MTTAACLFPYYVEMRKQVLKNVFYLFKMILI